MTDNGQDKTPLVELLTEANLVYLAQPIDFADSTPALADRYATIAKRIRGIVRDNGGATYDPRTAWDLHPNKVNHPQYPHTVNTYALSLADLVVVILHPGFKSFGVPIEIDMATRNRTPVAIVNVSDEPFEKRGLVLRALMKLGDITIHEANEELIR